MFSNLSARYDLSDLGHAIMTARFKFQEVLEEPEVFRLPWSYLFELLKDGRTPVRVITDEALKFYHKFLIGDGTIFELSAPSDYYKSFFPESQKYVLTNIAKNADMVVDMTSMPFDDDSVDAMLSMCAVEHIADYRRGFTEVHRVLKPKGRFLVCVPFMYCYHAAPDDYVRFTTSYLRTLMADFDLLTVRTLGTREVMIANMYHEKVWMQLDNSRLSRFFKRVLGSLILMKYLIRPSVDDTFYPAVLVLAEKK